MKCTRLLLGAACLLLGTVPALEAANETVVFGPRPFVVEQVEVLKPSEEGPPTKVTYAEYIEGVVQAEIGKPEGLTPAQRRDIQGHP